MDSDGDHRDLDRRAARDEGREPAEDEDDDSERQGAWMVQTSEPHEAAEDPIGMQRPTDRDESTAAEEFADSLSELPEARLIVSEPFWYLEESTAESRQVAEWVAESAESVDADNLAVQPVHHRTSVVVAGPNARSHRRSSSAQAASWGTIGSPPSIQRSVGAHRYCPEVQRPSGRARTMRPAVASRNSTRVERPIVPPHVFPSPNVSLVASSGTSTVR